MVTAGNTECQKEDLCAQRYRSVSLCLRFIAQFSIQNVAGHAVQAPDTPPESVDVFTVCLDQVGLGLGGIDSLQGIH